MAQSNTGNVHVDEHVIRSPVPSSKTAHYQSQVENGNCAWRNDSTAVINDPSSPMQVVGHVVDGTVDSFEYELPK